MSPQALYPAHQDIVSRMLINTHPHKRLGDSYFDYINYWVILILKSPSYSPIIKIVDREKSKKRVFKY